MVDKLESTVDNKPVVLQIRNLAKWMLGDVLGALVRIMDVVDCHPFKVDLLLVQHAYHAPRAIGERVTV